MDLIEFFRFYSERFKPETMMININDPIIFVRTSALFSTDPLTIIDPLNSENNPARGAYRIKEILEVFHTAFQVLDTKTK
jgi:DNA polymerase sigma